MLGFQNAHWYFGFNSDASLLEGNRIQDNGGNSFTTIATVEKYSALDQYLMGWRAPEEVEPEYQMFLVTGLPASFSRRIPQPGVSLTGTRRDIRLQEIIQAEGRRTPDHTVAQRRFRFAFILIVRQGTEPTADQLSQVETYRTEFERFFNEASSTRAFADSALRRNLSLSTFPAAGVLEGRTATATVTLQTAPAGTLTVSLQSQSGNVGVPPSVVIPAGQRAATFTINAVRAGVDEITAIADDALYASAYTRIQVSAPASVQLSPISGDRQVAVSGQPLADPVVVQVSDINRLPYPGARLQAAPSAGGAVNPVVATTEANGRASFRWTPGTSPSNQLRIFVEGAPESTGLAIQAGTGVVVASSVGDSATFGSGIAPGTLATVYGASLAAGTNAGAPFPWPTSIAGVGVQLNGQAAPVLFVSDQQVNFLVPSSFIERQAQIVVSNARGISTPLRSPVFLVAPGIFFDASTNFGAILNSGTTQSTSVQPARRGEFVEIYCTGLGPTRTFADNLQRTISLPQIAIGGFPARVTYSGLAPGYLGLYQVKVQVPDQAPSGAAPLILSQNGSLSNEVRIGIQ
jgi:uncharacterized protein (TIGR03437 family)